MSKMKKYLLTGISYVLVAALAIGGTIAYLQDSDEDVNVMTLGNVQIEQHEYERVQNADGSYEMVTSPKYGEGYKVQPFTQAKPLYPAVGTVTGYGTPVYWDQLGANAAGGQQTLAGLKNVQDKFVLVENTGKTDAYVRTIVAVELGSIPAADLEKVVMLSDGADNEPWRCVKVGAVEIDDNNYYVYEYIYTGFAGGRHAGGILPAGEISYSNLAQVYMKPEATNEDVKAIDGNGNGTYDILVLSQAVQAAGFENAKTALDAAFGAANVANAATWFSGDDFEAPIIVANAAQLQAALDAKEDATIIFGGNIQGSVVAEQPVDKDINVVIDGNGFKFDGDIKLKAFSENGADTLTIKNVNFVSDDADHDFIWSIADGTDGNLWRYVHNVTIDNCTFTATGAAVDTSVGIRIHKAYNVNVTNCTATNMHSLAQFESCDTTVTVDNAKTINCKNGISLNNTRKAVVKNSDLQSVGNGGYGIRVKAEVDGYGVTVENCKISAFVPVLVRNARANNYTANFSGINLTATNTFGYQVVFANGDWDNDSAAPAVPTGNYTATGLSGINVFGK